jgi:hypothetical protein
LTVGACNGSSDSASTWHRRGVDYFEPRSGRRRVGFRKGHGKVQSRQRCEPVGGFAVLVGAYWPDRHGWSDRPDWHRGYHWPTRRRWSARICRRCFDRCWPRWGHWRPGPEGLPRFSGFSGFGFYGCRTAGQHRTCRHRGFDRTDWADGTAGDRGFIDRAIGHDCSLV